MPARKTTTQPAPPADTPATITAALLECASAMRCIANAIDRLGTNGAGPQGAVEFLAGQVKQGLEHAAQSLAAARRD